MIFYATEFCFVAFYLYLCIAIIRLDMKYKKIYKLINNERDCYDCDYTGNAEDLISPLNKLFTKTFLTEELLSRVNEELKGKPHQKFHLVLNFIPFTKDKPITEVNVGIEYDSNLTATSTNYEEETTYIIIRIVNEFLRDLGYPVDSCNPNDLLDKLILEYSEFGKYFEVEIIK